MKMPPPLPDALQAWTDHLIDLSERLFFVGDVARALNILAANLLLIRQDEISASQWARLQMQKGRLLVKDIFLNGRHADEVLPALENTLRAALASDDALLIAQAYDLKGEALYFQQMTWQERNYDDALAALREAESRLRQLTAPDALSTNLLHLGLVHQVGLGDQNRARDYFAEADDLAAGFPLEKSYALRHLAFVQRVDGDYTSAIDNLSESLKLREQIGYAVYVPFSHISLGDTYAMLDNAAEDAAAQYEQGLQTAQQIGNRRAIMLAHYGLGILHKDRYQLNIALGIAQDIGHAGVIQAVQNALDDDA